MLMYPRKSKVNGKEVLVPDDCIVQSYEHLINNYRFVNVFGQMGVDPASFSLLFAMDSVNHDPITLLINSPGGDMDALFILYDIFRLIQSPVRTIGSLCYSAAALLLGAGEKGERYLLPHAKVMLHLISSMYRGTTRDIEIQQEQTKKYEQQMITMLRECGVTKSDEQILKDIDRDHWMNADETIAYGLADKVIDKDTLGKWLGGNPCQL